jgi:hypothetical protein
MGGIHQMLAEAPQVQRQICLRVIEVHLAVARAMLWERGTRTRNVRLAVPVQSSIFGN